MKAMRHALILGLSAIVLTCPLSVSAQWQKKPQSEWSEKDAQRMLNNSPWGRTQTFSSPVTLFRQPTTGQQGINSPTTARPADATHVFFRIRFLSAKPIRLAVSRMVELKQKQPISAELAARLKSLTEGEFLEYIVITVSCDSTEPGANVQQALGLLNTRGTADLKNDTFLEVKGGKRLFLQEYQQPRDDGLGARFIFPRLVDGKPFITPESEEIRFFCELSSNHRLDRRYKTKDMMYEGKLEY